MDLGRNTKISPYRYGDPRFGTERDQPANGPVIEYTLSPEELAKYGPPKTRLERDRFQEKQISITREQLIDALRRNQSWSVTMGELGIGRTQMLRLMSLHQINPENWKNKPKEELDVSTEAESVEQPLQKTKLEIARERMSKEELTRLKELGHSDVQVQKELGVDNFSFYKLKQEYGLYGATVKNAVYHKLAPQIEALKQDPAPAAAPVPEQEQVFAQEPEPVPEPEQSFEPAPEQVVATEEPPAYEAADDGIDWVIPGIRQTPNDMAVYCGKGNVYFSRPASNVFMQAGHSYIQIGVKEGRLYLKGHPEKIERVNYKLHKDSKTPNTRMKISGVALVPALQARGIERGKYLLEQKGNLWVGTRDRDEKEAPTA
ncbi:MAG: hypothetical protein WC364_04840 [Eubacteriales bacterium]|jgi:hypothetical protein